MLLTSIPAARICAFTDWVSQVVPNISKLPRFIFTFCASTRNQKQNGLPFCHRLAHFVLEYWPLNENAFLPPTMEEIMQCVCNAWLGTRSGV